MGPGDEFAAARRALFLDAPCPATERPSGTAALDVMGGAPTLRLQAFSGVMGRYAPRVGPRARLETRRLTCLLRLRALLRARLHRGCRSRHRAGERAPSEPCSALAWTTAPAIFAVGDPPDPLTFPIDVQFRRLDGGLHVPSCRVLTLRFHGRSIPLHPNPVVRAQFHGPRVPGVPLAWSAPHGTWPISLRRRPAR